MSRRTAKAGVALVPAESDVLVGQQEVFVGRAQAKSRDSQGCINLWYQECHHGVIGRVERSWRAGVRPDNGVRRGIPHPLPHL